MDDLEMDQAIYEIEKILCTQLTENQKQLVRLSFLKGVKAGMLQSRITIGLI